ncbi:MAG: DUF1507 family protein [Liquorilactobacillus hordei]|uniref:Uncharacterized protein n=2 Tax=Liquorilactobacillus hordei TaxID=468911 RepID=A0A3S6QQP8_9LACO|nr:DUF1507 family protein [Liquorilactobacillus hordei]AUJ30029.1 hypothetical protein BSQ49_07345 [Liquorilactobacillus hordei]MBZ2404705.1 DUF1507 domain-containing protein [Liquorilactobacillus hordei]QYH52635.1 DUF1507 family protein [Liquorilactobacillus hordei DSM 19519]
MQEIVTRQEMLKILQADSEKIRVLLDKQRNLLCLSQCPAFEEVADTQLFGFSKEVHLAERCGLITLNEAQQMIQDLEHLLSSIYVSVGEDE